MSSSATSSWDVVGWVGFGSTVGADGVVLACGVRGAEPCSDVFELPKRLAIRSSSPGLAWMVAADGVFTAAAAAVDKAGVGGAGGGVVLAVASDGSGSPAPKLCPTTGRLNDGEVEVCGSKLRAVTTAAVGVGSLLGAPELVVFGAGSPSVAGAPNSALTFASKPAVSLGCVPVFVIASGAALDAGTVTGSTMAVSSGMAGGVVSGARFTGTVAGATYSLAGSGIVADFVAGRSKVDRRSSRPGAGSACGNAAPPGAEAIGGGETGADVC